MLGTIKGKIRKHFLTGLMIFIPMALTIFLVTWIDTGIMAQLDKLPENLHPRTYLHFDIPGLGILITGIFIYLIGFLGSVYLGRTIVEAYEKLLDRVPGVRWFYVVSKQLLEAIFKLMEQFQKGGDRFSGVVLVQYPRIGIYSLAFVTGDSRGEIQAITKEKVVNVFIPTTPNPTSGFYLMIPEEELTSLDLSVEQAFRLLISAGMVGSENEKARPIKNGAGQTFTMESPLPQEGEAKAGED